MIAISQTTNGLMDRDHAYCLHVLHPLTEITLYPAAPHSHTLVNLAAQKNRAGSKQEKI